MWNEMLRNCEYKIHSFAAEGKPDELRCSKKVPELKKLTGGGEGNGIQEEKSRKPQGTDKHVYFVHFVDFVCFVGGEKSLSGRAASLRWPVISGQWSVTSGKKVCSVYSVCPVCPVGGEGLSGLAAKRQWRKCGQKGLRDKWVQGSRNDMRVHEGENHTMKIRIDIPNIHGNIPP